MTAYYFPDSRCAFVRVPKTASTTIMDVFFGKATAKADGPLPSKEFWSYDKSFAFIRHPVERFRSIKAMFLERGMLPRYDAPKEWKEPTTEQILDLVRDKRYKLSKANYQEVLKIHAIPMIHPYFSLNKVDKIFRYEDMEEEWIKLADYLGIQPPPMNMLNVSKIPVVLTDEEIKMVQDFYKEDLKTFNYRKVK